MKAEKILVISIAVLGIAALSLVFTGAIWWLWCWAVPQLWASGPKNLTSPPFWLFYATIFLVNITRSWLVPSEK